MSTPTGPYPEYPSAQPPIQPPYQAYPTPPFGWQPPPPGYPPQPPRRRGGGWALVGLGVLLAAGAAGIAVVSVDKTATPAARTSVAPSSSTVAPTTTDQALPSVSDLRSAMLTIADLPAGWREDAQNEGKPFLLYGVAGTANSPDCTSAWGSMVSPGPSVFTTTAYADHVLPMAETSALAYSTGDATTVFNSIVGTLGRCPSVRDSDGTSYTYSTVPSSQASGDQSATYVIDVTVTGGGRGTGMLYISRSGDTIWTFHTLTPTSQANGANDARILLSALTRWRGWHH